MILTKDLLHSLISVIDRKVFKGARVGEHLHDFADALAVCAAGVDVDEYALV